jgi:hypothetical protein
MIIIYIAIGIVIGSFIGKKIPNTFNILRSSPYNEYRITLHGYFPIHETGKSKNSFAETQSITVTVKAESEKKAEDFIVDIIESEFRIEIENIEKVNAITDIKVGI